MKPSIHRVLAALFTWSLAVAPGWPGPIPMSAADRLVEQERAQAPSALAQTASDSLLLRSRYQRELAASETPQAQLALIAALHPINSAEAVGMLEEACLVDPTFVFARLELARAMAYRDPSRQGPLLREAWTLRPDDPAAARARGLWLLGQGRAGDLAEVCRDLLREAAPAEQQAAGHFLAGRAAWAVQDWAGAHRHFIEAARLAPFDPDISIAWIQLAVSRGQISDAAGAVEKRTDDPHTQARMARALADALNVAARRELIPMGSPVAPSSLDWRRQIVRGLDLARPHLPFGAAWDADRLAIWLDFAEGRYREAWARFERRIPQDLVQNAPDGSRRRWATLRSAVQPSLGETETTYLRVLAGAAAHAGWTAEALEVARRLNQSPRSRPEDREFEERLASHQAYLATLAPLFEGAGSRSLGAPPDPPEILGFMPRAGERHPSSGAQSLDPTVRHFRERHQYFAWMSAPREEKAYRVMAILSEDPAYIVRSDRRTRTVNLVIGEDIIPPGGAAVRAAGMTDTRRRDHCHVSLLFDDVINDLFVLQADREARLRLDSYMQREADPTREVPFDSDAFSPDTLAALAQGLFEEQGIGSSAFDRHVLPTPEESRNLRDKALLAFVDHVARHEACHLALQSKWDIRTRRKELHANLYALGYGAWPRMGLYYCYRAALAGSRHHRIVVNDIARAATSRGFLRRDLQPLLQLHTLSDMQIQALARERFRQVD